MGLQALAPSILSLANTDCPPEGLSNPARRLTVLLGAGASLFAGAPSTAALTSAICDRVLSGKILNALRADPETSEANFEDVLHVLEDLEALSMSGARAPTMLRPFLVPSSRLAAITSDYQELRNERFGVLESIASAFGGINYDAAWRVLYRVLRPLLDTFDIDVFTLNYDQVADLTVYGLSVLSGKPWFDGFGQRINMDGSLTFRADQYAHWSPDWRPIHLTLGHLHGSLLLAYHTSDRRMAHSTQFELVQAQTYEVAQRTWREATDAARADPDLDFENVAPIVSGLRKIEKLNVQPYANYFTYFTNCISHSPYLMIIGYGAGDDHINYWLREYTLIHGEDALAVEIRRSEDPAAFTMQKFGAYDLRWSKVPGTEDAFTSAAGIRCLTVTGGVTGERRFEGRLNDLIKALYDGTLA